MKVTTSERNPRKMSSLKVQLTGFRALAHSSKHLYQPFKRHAHLYEDGGYSEKDAVALPEFRDFSTELQAVTHALFEETPLYGYIDESRHIYDSKMPHFSYQVDRLLDQGCHKRMLVMVRDVETKRSSSSPVISLTLLNSRLQGSKQINLALEESEFALLGPINGGNTPLRPLNTLQNRLAQLGISPYATTVATEGVESESKFDFMKLREI